MGVEEERAALSEVQATDANIALVVAQVARLRDIRDAIDRRLSEKRAQTHLEGQIIAQCTSLMRPNTTNATPRQQRLRPKDEHGGAHGITPTAARYDRLYG